MQKDNMINMVDGAKTETQEVKKWASLSSGLYLQWSHPDLSHTLSYSQAIFPQPCEEERDHFLCWQHNFTDFTWIYAGSEFGSLCGKHTASPE